MSGTIPTAQKGNTSGLISIVLSVLTFILCFLVYIPYIGSINLILGACALILSIISIVMTSKNGGKVAIAIVALALSGIALTTATISGLANGFTTNHQPEILYEGGEVDEFINNNEELEGMLDELEDDFEVVEDMEELITDIDEDIEAELDEMDDDFENQLEEAEEE